MVLRNSKTELLPNEQMKISMVHRIALSKSLHIALALLCFGIVVPALSYIIFYSHEFENASSSLICSHSEKHHIRCGAVNTTETACAELGCCFSPISGCFHSYPAKYQYQAVDWRRISDLAQTAVLVSVNKLTPFATESVRLNVVVRRQSARQLMIDIGTNVRVDDAPQANIDAADTVYDFEFDRRFFAIDVVEKSRKTTLLTTSRGALIADAHYFEWSIYLGTTRLYGFGEYEIDERPFRKLYLRNGRAENNFVPVIIAQTTKDSIDYYHALMFECDAPLEFEVIKSSNVVVRGLAIEKIRVKLIVGTNYTDLLHELRRDAGSTETSVALWTHGIHIYDNVLRDGDSVATKTTQFLSTNTMPFDSHCIDERIWFSNVNQSDLLEAARLLRDAGKKVMLSIYSQDFLGNATSQQIFHLRNATSETYMGKVESRSVAYVDWENSAAADWIANRIKTLSEINADGIVIQNNIFRDDTSNISHQLDENWYRNLPQNFSEASENMVPLTLMLSNSDVQIVNNVNLWPSVFLDAVLRTQSTMPFVMASIYGNNNAVAGASPGYPSTWQGLRMAMRGMLADALAGIQFSGSAVCGNGSSVYDEELCIRWYQLSAVMPVFRVHANNMLTHFSSLAQLHMISAVELRYSLLAYINTITITGELVIRPMMYHFSSIDLTDIQQFLLGEDLMVVPIMAANQSYTERDIYFPDKYYDFRFGYAITDTGTTKYPIHASPLLIFVRIGRIIPIHQSRRTNSAGEARLKPLTLIMALLCQDEKDQIYEAHGRLSISKSQHWIFHANSTTLMMESPSSDIGLESICGTSPVMTSKVNKLRIYGTPQKLVVESQIELDLCHRGISKVEFSLS